MYHLELTFLKPNLELILPFAENSGGALVQYKDKNIARTEAQSALPKNTNLELILICETVNAQKMIGTEVEIVKRSKLAQIKLQILRGFAYIF